MIAIRASRRNPNPDFWPDIRGFHFGIARGSGAIRNAQRCSRASRVPTLSLRSKVTGQGLPVSSFLLTRIHLSTFDDCSAKRVMSQDSRIKFMVSVYGPWSASRSGIRRRLHLIPRIGVDSVSPS
jgi:hypothetical protein